MAEHIAVAEEGIFGNITGKVMKTELTPELREHLLRDDGRVHAMLEDRTRKRQAPERHTAQIREVIDSPGFPR